MAKKTKTIPEGLHTMTPYLTVKEAAKAIKFYKDAFGAKEVELNKTPDGKVIHATLKIGDSAFMLCDEFPESSWGISTPRSLGGTTVLFYIYVEDVDTAFNKAVKAGAKVKMPVEDMFWGDRYGQVEDPFGHLWALATHIADFSPDQIEQAAKKSSTKLAKATR